MKKVLFFILASISISIYAQNTVTLEEGSVSPKANLEIVSWMEGHWKGEAFGGITEEVWSPPLAGSMMFVFKHIIDDTVNFYEVGHIREWKESLAFELKHFHGDLKGWEEKDEVQRFKLVKFDGNRVFFDGFTFEKVSDNEINIYGRIGNKDGTVDEVKFNYTKQ